MLTMLEVRITEEHTPPQAWIVATVEDAQKIVEVYIEHMPSLPTEDFKAILNEYEVLPNTLKAYTYEEWHEEFFAGYPGM